MSFPKEALSAALFSYFNSHSRDIPLNFSFKATEEDFSLKLLASKIALEIIKNAVSEGKNKILSFKKG